MRLREALEQATEESRRRGYKTVVVALDDLTTLLAALRDTGPRPDRASAEGLRHAIAREFTYTGPHDYREARAIVDAQFDAALRDTGPRPDSGIDDHEHDHDCQSGNGKTHRHEYRHTHPVEHLHRHEHPTDEQVARRIALSTPRTETSDEG